MMPESVLQRGVPFEHGPCKVCRTDLNRLIDTPDKRDPDDPIVLSFVFWMTQ